MNWTLVTTIPTNGGQLVWDRADQIYVENPGVAAIRRMRGSDLHLLATIPLDFPLRAFDLDSDGCTIYNTDYYNTGDGTTLIHRHDICTGHSLPDFSVERR
jgi:hypothetical protein